MILIFQYCSYQTTIIPMDLTWQAIYRQKFIFLLVASTSVVHLPSLKTLGQESSSRKFFKKEKIRR